MAKKKDEENEEAKVIPGTYVVKPDGSHERIGDVPDEEADEFGPKVKKYKLYREDATKEWCVLGKHESRPGMEEFVKDTYGGGSYKAVGYNENGKYEIGNSKYFKVDVLYPQKNPLGITQSTNSNATLPIQSGLVDNTSFARLEILLTKMIELQMTNQASKTDPLEVIEKVARIFKPEQAPQSETAIEKMVGMFKQGFDLGQMSNGDGGYWQIAEKLGLPALELIKEIASKPNGQGQQILEKAKQVNGGTVQQAGRHPTMFEQLLKFVPQIIPAAKSNTETAEVVDSILDRVPPFLYDSIYEEVIKPDFLENVVKAVPDVKNYEVWFKGFVEKFKEMLSPEPEEIETGEENV